ncbi:MAG: sugar-binding transcriptional regulator [Actinobacteria bacterium]|nr:sugar-binding transcriptional regulator [Actinomycetota bacterium]
MSSEPGGVIAAARDPEHDRAELLAEIGELYYLHGRDQSSIAEEVGTSRSNVSRLLTEARRRGIVDIRINHPLGRALELERRLTTEFGLDEARVLATRPRRASGGGGEARDSLTRVGRLGAGYLLEVLSDGRTIGVSWGTSLEALVNAVAPTRARAVEVVQLLGGLSWVSQSLSGHELGRRLADRLGGRFAYLHAPAIIDSTEARELLLRQEGIADVLAKGRKADLAILGIGSLGRGSSRALFSRPELSSAERREIQSGEAVGDICARLFDRDGRPCDVAANLHVVGLELEDLVAIPHRIGIACGLEKVAGITGALRGRLVNVLITDEATAVQVLAGR